MTPLNGTVTSALHIISFHISSRRSKCRKTNICWFIFFSINITITVQTQINGRLTVFIVFYGIIAHKWLEFHKNTILQIHERNAEDLTIIEQEQTEHVARWCISILRHFLTSIDSPSTSQIDCWCCHLGVIEQK